MHATQEAHCHSQLHSLFIDTRLLLQMLALDLHDNLLMGSLPSSWSRLKACSPAHLAAQCCVNRAHLEIKHTTVFMEGAIDCACCPLEMIRHVLRLFVL